MAEVLIVVGSLNRRAPFLERVRGVGLSLFRFDADTGQARLLSQDGSIDNPSFLAADRRTGCIYAVSEVFGWHEGTISAYRVEAAGLRYINKQPTLGSLAAHCSLTRGGGHLLVANYAAGPQGEGPDQALAVSPVREDGGLGSPTSSVAHRGRGPDPVRQERPHPH